MHRVGLAVALIMIATVCVAQEPGGAQASATASAGEKTIIGCVGVGSPSGFVINTKEGRTVNLFTDRDLSAYVGKQVEIKTKWRRRGLTLTEESAKTSTPAEDAGAAAKAPAPDTHEFGGSISMTFSGKVMGPCQMKK